MHSIPWNDLWDTLRLVVGPAIAASVAVTLIARRLRSSPIVPWMAAFSVVCGIIAANWACSVIDWRIDGLVSLVAHQFRALFRSAFPETPLNAPNMSPRDWLPWLAGLVLLAELSVRRARILVGLTRSVLAGLIAWMVTDRDQPSVLMSWLIGAAIVSQWLVVSAVARRTNDGSVPVALAVSFAGTGVVLLFAHSARLCDIALLCAAALIGPTVAGFKWRIDTSGAVAAGAVFLPAFMFIGYQDTFSNVPWLSFVLIGLAPLALAPALIVPNWSRHLIFLPLIPIIAGIVLAMQRESLCL